LTFEVASEIVEIEQNFNQPDLTHKANCPFCDKVSSNLLEVITLLPNFVKTMTGDLI